MVEILFYHLQSRPLDAVLPGLVERSRQRGWKVVVQAATPERLTALDDLLWTYSDESFLPHGTEADPDAAAEPVVLALSDANPNAADVRFLVEGAPLPPDLDTYVRLVVMFDGNDEDAVSRARAMWSQLRKESRQPTYWQQDETGRWQKKA